MIGQTIAHYRITAKLGAGGMGEVYRATDTKLGRDVALKVLPPEFSRDEQRLARFQREAQVLASLNHPNIAAIYGLEEAGAASSAPTCALTMELVEGLTLAERIAQGALPLDEALPIARQMAEALEYAHEHGIIHRDLKPANIKVTPDGQVKVLDFGLAKALVGEATKDIDSATSPTLSLAATKAGMVLGTAAYMSPEQAKGKSADRRADIWSFGAVLFEMLTGRRAFPGEDVSDTLVSVLRDQPDWTALPAAVPAPVRRLIERCMAKDTRTRLQWIGEARIALEEAISHPAGEAEAISATRVSTLPLWRRAWPWAVVSAVLALAFLLTLSAWLKPPQHGKVLRLSTDLEASLDTSIGSGAILSPDGSTLVFRTGNQSAGGVHLYVRKLDQLRATMLEGTEGARNQFFSPDGQWIAYFAGNKLKKISVTGGAAIALGDASDDRGGWWGEDGQIVFAASTREGLLRISPEGGKPEPLTQLDKTAGEVTHRWPQVLPGAQTVLYTADDEGSNYDDANLVVQSLVTGARKVVHRGGFYGRYLPSGHLVFVHRGTLFAAPFDLQRLEVTAQPVPAIEGLTSVSGTGGAQFAFSKDGIFLYVPGADVGSSLPIWWMDQQGRFEPLRAVPGNYVEPSFSPDGRRLAVQLASSGGSQKGLWVYEWARDTMTRLTFDSAGGGEPAWTPDGRRITFSSDRNKSGKANLYWRGADGTGSEDRLTDSSNEQYWPAWHPSGKFLAYCEERPKTGADLLILPMAGDEKAGWKPGKPAAFLDGPFNEWTPAFSPDGRWLAYASNESGQYEVYVRPFPGPGGKWQVSNGGGSFPTWSPNGRELFYLSSERQIWVATYRVAGDSFVADKPRLWSSGRLSERGLSRNFALHPDGKRFAVLKAPDASAEKRDKVVLILNFFDELRRIAPPGGKRTE